MRVAEVMAGAPGGSLPEQAGSWGDLKGAYRFFNHPGVTPEKIGGPHRAQTRRRCAGQKVVLCVQDGTDLQGVKVGGRRGGMFDEYIQHTALAVSVEGRALGVLDQRWFKRQPRPQGETRAQRNQRWRESDVWAESVAAVGRRGGPGLAGCRVIHVCDAAADNLRFMHAAVEAQVGFLARAYQNRRVEECTDKLWPHLAKQAVSGTIDVTLGTQRDKAGRITRQSRQATLAVRYATVRLECPWNHGDDLEPLTVQAVYLRELDPPKEVEPVEWMLLTSEAVTSHAEACVICGYYQKRWVIEEWHRVIKEGCKLEESQLQQPQSLQCLAALKSVIAVRMLELRDLAREQIGGDTSTNVQALRRRVPAVWIAVLATLRGANPKKLTPREFWEGIAGLGGWIGRASDGPPGWKTLWRGWQALSQMVRYAEAAAKTKRSPRKSCG